MESRLRINTIGFTKKSAREFFSKLETYAVSTVIDTRLNNVSQLAGFTKKEDLKFFLKKVSNIDYQHIAMLAPEQEMLDYYKKKGGDWAEYERKYLQLIESRGVESKLTKEQLHNSCLLCSEETPEYCHRRLVAEYLQRRWNNVEIRHII